MLNEMAAIWDIKMSKAWRPKRDIHSAWAYLNLFHNIIALRGYAFVFDCLITFASCMHRVDEIWRYFGCYRRELIKLFSSEQQEWKYISSGSNSIMTLAKACVSCWLRGFGLSQNISFDAIGDKKPHVLVIILIMRVAVEKNSRKFAKLLIEFYDSRTKTTTMCVRVDDEWISVVIKSI